LGWDGAMSVVVIILSLALALVVHFVVVLILILILILILLFTISVVLAVGIPSLFHHLATCPTLEMNRVGPFTAGMEISWGSTVCKAPSPQLCFVL